MAWRGGKGKRGKASKRGDDDREEGDQGDRGRDVTEPLFTAEDVAEAFRASMGSVSEAARTLKCNRTTLYAYCRLYPQVQKSLDEARAAYKMTCQELARDNHLTQLMEGGSAATTYELEKMEPKPDGQYLDLSKLNADEIVILHRLLQKAKPDGSGEKSA